MLRLVGVNIPDNVDLKTGLKMIKGLDGKHCDGKIEAILTKARLYKKKRLPNGKYEKVYPLVGDLSWKEKSRLIDLVEMPRAILTHIGASPKKLRLIADEVRGKSADEALAILSFIEKGCADKLLRLLKSAIKNAENNHGLKNVGDLYVAKFTIDGGPVMKRFMPRARGRADRIRCRTSHAKIVLREKFSMAKFAEPESKAPQKSPKKAVRKKVDSATKAEKSQGGKK